MTDLLALDDSRLFFFFATKLSEFSSFFCFRDDWDLDLFRDLDGFFLSYAEVLILIFASFGLSGIMSSELPPSEALKVVNYSST